MALSVDFQRVKAKCGIAVTSYDTTINALISEMVPVLEFAIDPVFLADTGNAGLVATLNLGATEIVCGEFLAQLNREPGAMEIVRIGEIALEPLRLEHSKAFDLIAAGSLRLSPFLKKDVGVLYSRIGSAGGKQPEE